MTALYIIISAFIIYFIIKIATTKRTENVNIAFAGAYDGAATVKSVPKERNKTIYTEGENEIDLSGYDKFLISGRSLEKVGLPDGTFVYSKPLKDGEDIFSICNHFVIFKYDVKRLAEEHPEITNPIDGYKARKVITICPNNLCEQDFKEKFRPIILNDGEINDSENCIECLWHKYSFASASYKDDPELIVSITYKKGEQKDYSFHSVKFLKGIVKYKSI